MVLVNVAAVSSSKTLFRWTILSVLDEAVTVREYFESIIVPRLVGESDTSCTRLGDARVGKSKEALDAVDLDLKLCEVVAVFGHFLKVILYIILLITI